mgnify:CR=1 FL=1
MTENPMKFLYKEFGEKPQEGQTMLSIANIFYLMGQDKEKKNKTTKKEELLKELLKE